MYAKKSAKYMFCFIKASIHKNIQIITFELLTQGRMKAKARESARSEQFRRIFTTGIVVVPCLFPLTNLNRTKAFFLHSSSSLSAAAASPPFFVGVLPNFFPCHSKMV